MSVQLEIIKTTCPRDCYDACGIHVVKENGQISRVMGDPDHPVNRGTLCGKCTLAYNGSWRDPDARLTNPLRRTGAKGEGRFEAITWDEALAAIADKLKTTISDSGSASVIQTHYTGTFSMIGYGFPLRFFNKIGATEVDPDTVCNKAGHVALQLMFGSSMDGFDPRTSKDSSCILIWGANPSTSAPHAHKVWLKDFSGTVIVVDPIRHQTACEADIFLQPFPGSDAALAFAMLNVIKREGLIDEHFVSNYVAGYDELVETIVQCTPEWGEQNCGVPADLIETAALAYAKGPSLLWLGQGLQRQATGGNVIRSCAMLPALTGNIGKPGTGFLYLNGTSSRGILDEFIPAPHLNTADSKCVSHMDLAERLEDTTSSKMLFCWNNNIVASCPNQSRLKGALQRDDLFTVAIDLFATDTTDYADIVLPAASFLEFDDLVVSYFNYTVSAQVKASEPIGESLPNQEIFRRLSEKMGFTEPELFESDRSMIGKMLDQTGTGLSFDELSTIGTVYISDNPVIPFSDHSFSTPSGKIEVVSDSYSEHGVSRAPQACADQRPRDGWLRLLSPASFWHMNSSYDNVGKVRKQAQAAHVFLNPNEALKRGLSEGSAVIVASNTGRLPLSVSISDCVPGGVALVHKGRWPKLDPSCANVNVLNSGQKSDLGESSSVHSVEVEIITA